MKNVIFYTTSVLFFLGCAEEPDTLVLYLMDTDDYARWEEISIEPPLGCEERVHITDDLLERKLRMEAGKPESEGDLTFEDVYDIKKLELEGGNYNYLTGLKCLPNLTVLHIGRNNITSLNELSTITSLMYLTLGENPVDNIDPIKNLINLEILRIDSVSITDISPLVQNEGIDNGDEVVFYSTAIDCMDSEFRSNINTLTSRGVQLTTNCQLK